MAFGIAFENGIRYDGRTGGEAHKPRTDRMEKEFKLETAPLQWNGGEWHDLL